MLIALLTLLVLVLSGVVVVEDGTRENEIISRQLLDVVTGSKRIMITLISQHLLHVLTIECLDMVHSFSMNNHLSKRRCPRVASAFE